MNERLKSFKEQKRESDHQVVLQKKKEDGSVSQFVDNRPLTDSVKTLQAKTCIVKHRQSSFGNSQDKTIQRQTDCIQFGNWIWSNGAWGADPDSPPADPMPVAPGAYDYEYRADAPVAAAAPIVLPIVYGAAHGDLHFISKPTKHKSAWTMAKPAALAMMNQSITNRMADIVQAVQASPHGQVSLLLIEDAAGPIGASTSDGAIWRYQIQLQADMTGISYHGFPDDRAQHTGLGTSRNNLS